MELQTARQVSKDYGISTRMLRYYEQAGLIQSLRKEDYAYRVYDESAIIRLKQIIILRKLRVPVKQIISILNNSDAVQTVEIFRQNINQLDQEITALSTVKSILTRFAEEINAKTEVNLNLLGDEALFSIIGSLSFPDNQIKEDFKKENFSMEELNKANEDLIKMEDKDVRIVYLPPMTVAAAYASGDGCEGKTLDMINKFIKESGLLKIKPDARSFGFDCSNGAVEVGENSHVYEVWVSVPDDMDVPAPLVRRKFSGGLYAAHVLRAWDFQDWRRLAEWVNSSEKYENDWGSPRWDSPETVFGQGFEETLNFYNYSQNPEMKNLQLDLLFPIKEKKKASLILNSGVDYASFSVDIGSINKNFKYQYDEEKFNLPSNLNLADYNTVIVNGMSAEGQTAVKFYDINGNEAFVMYNNKSENNADWIYNLSTGDKDSIITKIGIMSQDSNNYSAVINSITFKK